MKKPLIILLIIAVAVSLCACAEKADAEPTAPATETAALTEKPAETVTEAPTETPTEKHAERTYTVITQSTGETPETNDGYFTYTNNKYGWSVDIPEVWNEYGMIVEYDDTGEVAFKHEESFFSEYHLSGNIFSLVTLPAGSTFYTANGSTGTDIYQDDEYMVCWDKPSDVQTDLHFEDEINQLKDTREQILESFRWE
ncbi:MAG: hypothetical protein IJH32_04590 [Ruminococcus sp.]|nr:hypothetical protein [Ruminococcus sp.]